jgi:hypothetical protein
VADTVPQVTQPMRLPNAEAARIPTDKLVRYVLDETHPRGRHKARVFASGLAITARDWRYLHDQILAALPSADLRATRITPFGVAYEVVLTIDGLNGASAPVVTTWIIQGAGPPRLTSAWVDIP